MKLISEQCCKRVYTASNTFRGALCAKRAIHDHKGERYCSVHCPPNVEQRAIQTRARHDAQREEYKRTRDVPRAIADAMADALSASQSELGDWRGAVSEALDDYHEWSKP